MAFIRFTLPTRDADSGVAAGTFSLAYELRDAAHLQPDDRKLLAEILAWFEKNLDTPKRFNRSSSKGFYRRTTRGIAWFKDSANEHLARMHRLRRILERYGHPVTVLCEKRVGYVVYEDTFQVVAEPFSDTRVDL